MLVISEMIVRATIKYHFILTKTEFKNETSVVEKVEKLESSYTTVRMENLKLLWKSLAKFFKQLSLEFLYNPRISL